MFSPICIEPIQIELSRKALRHSQPLLLQLIAFVFFFFRNLFIASPKEVSIITLYIKQYLQILRDMQHELLLTHFAWFLYFKNKFKHLDEGVTYKAIEFYKILISWRCLIYEFYLFFLMSLWNAYRNDQIFV